jgi:hypothetical protein
MLYYDLAPPPPPYRIGNTERGYNTEVIQLNPHLHIVCRNTVCRTADNITTLCTIYTLFNTHTQRRSDTRD